MRFERYRARPMEDFLPRLKLAVSGPIHDLGCGTGNLTRQLKARWP
jgi:trans-aconitate methyltransferase